MNLRITVFWSFLVATLLTFAVSVRAQEDEAPEESSAEEEQAVVSGPKGDVLHFKSGTVMSGIQILRSTTLFYEVQLVEGVDPLMIPRKQVERVEMDDFDPMLERLRREMFPEAEEVSMASGEKVTRELMDKLEGPMSDEALSYERKDFVKILKEIAGRLEVKLLIDESIRAIQPNRRRWNLDTTPETTFISLLRNDLVGKFKNVEVQFENDTVSIMTKEAAKKLKASGAAEEN